MEINIWQFILDCTHLVSNWLIDLNYIFIYIKTPFTIFFSQFFSIIGLVTFLSLWGFNFSFWGIMGFFRLIEEKFKQIKLSAISKVKNLSIDVPANKITKTEVAIIVPAHNEELVVAKTINSLLRLVSPSNIFIISDGSVDKTAAIVRNYNVQVLELSPAHGKAGALEAGIRYFSLDQRFQAVVFVDADTVLPAEYLDKALPYFNDLEVVAVAGYARSLWDPIHQTFRQSYFIAHREMVYTLSQLLLKFGQSWKYANVATIIPGFASIYRSSVLGKINLNPPGLVIEDFNMTFEVHHKQLGRIVHHPKVSGYTQDPDNFKDYYRQIKRWDLGFWQTVKLHGFWPSKFSATLIIFISEVLLSSLILVAVPLLLIVLPILTLPQFQLASINLLYLLIKILLFGIWLPNIILSIVVGMIKKRPQYFYYSPVFIFLKFIDSLAFLLTLPKAFFSHSSGRWISPSRRID